jgi:hypothetical protein
MKQTLATFVVTHCHRSNEPRRLRVILLAKRYNIDLGDGGDRFFPSTFISTRLFFLEQFGLDLEVGDAFLYS